MLVYSPSSISGKTSKVALNVSGAKSWKWTSVISGVSTGFRFSASSCLLQLNRNQVLQNLLPDIAGELFPDQGGGRLPGTEALQPGTLLNVVDNAAGFALYHLNGNGDFQRVLATFY